MGGADDVADCAELSGGVDDQAEVTARHVRGINQVTIRRAFMKEFLDLDGKRFRITKL